MRIKNKLASDEGALCTVTCIQKDTSYHSKSLAKNLDMLTIKQ